MKETDKKDEELPILSRLTLKAVDAYKKSRNKEHDEKELQGLTTEQRLQKRSEWFAKEIIGTRPHFWIIDYNMSPKEGEEPEVALSRFVIDVFSQKPNVDFENEYDDVYTQVIACICGCLRMCYESDLPEILLVAVPHKDPQKYSFIWQRALEDINYILKTRRDGYSAVQWNTKQTVKALETGKEIENPIIRYDQDIITTHTPVVLLDTISDDLDVLEAAMDIELKTNCNVLAIFSLAKIIE